LTISRRLSTAVRLFETIRHLRLRQIVYQVWYRLYRGTLPDIRSLSTRSLVDTQRWVSKPTCWEPGAAFTFLNERREHPGPAQWEQSGASKLWLYNLHYFDCLGLQQPLKTQNTKATDQSDTGYQNDCALLIEQWIEANTDIAGTGWEPYPTSLRIVNWIKWQKQGNQLGEGARNSLSQQAQWLSTRLEHHILANHLFANAKALVFAGLFFEGTQADRWLSKGVTLVNRELDEQILEDGAHFELSPMYHAIILEDVLDLLNLAYSANDVIDAALIVRWQSIAERMLSWQRSMLHPDGDIAFFNDASFGIARTATELEDYAASLGISLPENTTKVSVSTYSRPSGFGILHKGPFKVIADVADIKPSYQPGHTHADSLSCEMSIGQDRVFVNSGTSTYVKGPLRDWQRSTAAHNTLNFDGRNSSDVWDGFRVASRAKIIDVKWFEENGAQVLQASHDGYRLMASRPLHTRQWRLTDLELEVTDWVTFGNDTPRSSKEVSEEWQGSSDCLAMVIWLLHPSVEVIGTSRLRTASGRELQITVEGADIQVSDGIWYPQFGVEIPTKRLTISRQIDGFAEIKFSVRCERLANNET